VNVVPHPQAHAIVCLEYQASCLYAEVIQVVENRRIGWFRPLCLKIVGEDLLDSSDPLGLSYDLYSLQPGVDLLWPLVLFRLALDTEVVPLLGELQKQLPLPATTVAQARCQLNRFIYQVWQAYPEVF
jgi:hypothetical protein